ncbi:MAG TPA: histidine kinase [Actinoplanes sp.]|nr:histidine kinase [Actinoplanes sp.]
METSRPAIAREAVGPLRRLVLGPSRRLEAPRWRFLWYGVPLGLLALLGLGATNVAYLEDTRGLPTWLALLLSAGAVLPVAIAVRRPVVAWRVAYPMLFLGTVYGRPTESWPWAPVQIVGFLVVMVLLAVFEQSAVTAWATAFTIVVPFLYADRANAFGAAVLLAAIALLGDLLSRRRRSREQLAEQAELTELERARRAILEERARIAREMHDVVAHHMSMIAVQAETAPYRVPDLAPPARAELATIATAARSALADMRRLLGVLRAETDEAMREPQPGPAELPALVATAQRAGMQVTYAGNDLDPVPEAVGLAAYRIVQEALANAARHAPGAAVQLLVRALPDRLAVTVHNGPGGGTGPATGPGHGLVGMRERAELLGGELTAGPDGRGGYLVEATLPYAGGGSS